MNSIAPAVLTIAAMLLSLLGCAANGDQIARKWIAEMDARPQEERVPNWDVIRGMMMREAPVVGAMAPDFKLETDDGTATISLSSFREKLPVVLIFGSWT